MTKSKLLFIDLSQKKTKSIAEAITSNTARKVMDHLADKTDSEQQIATVLNVPLSTVHYHIQKLMEAGLIKTEEFHYSPKGREVNHYKLASQYIIIAPSKDTSLREKLKTLLPVGGIVIGIAAILRMIEKMGVSKVVAKSADVAMVTSEQAIAAPQLMQEAIPVVAQTTSMDFSLWFLLGGIGTIFIYLLVAFIQEKMKRQ